MVLTVSEDAMQYRLEDSMPSHSHHSCQ